MSNPAIPHTPRTPKAAFFNSHVNPAAPPILPTHITTRLIPPLTTALLVALILASIKPPFVQKRNKKDKPTGALQWGTLIIISLAAGLMALGLPYIVQFLKHGNTSGS